MYTRIINQLLQCYISWASDEHDTLQGKVGDLWCSVVSPQRMSKRDFRIKNTTRNNVIFTVSKWESFGRPLTIGIYNTTTRRSIIEYFLLYYTLLITSVCHIYDLLYGLLAVFMLKTSKSIVLRSIDGCTCKSLFLFYRSAVVYVQIADNVINNNIVRITAPYSGNNMEIISSLELNNIK